MDKYLIIICCLFVVLFLLEKVTRISRKKRNHNHKIQTAYRIYSKLKSFTGEYRSQQIITYLRKINPYAFEELVLTMLEQNGYKIKRNSSYSGDGGIDGIIYLNEKKLLLQVKRYSNDISAKHLQDFENMIQKMNAAGGLFVHTGSTSGRQYLKYKATDLQIISGQNLVDLILSTNLKS